MYIECGKPLGNLCNTYGKSEQLFRDIRFRISRKGANIYIDKVSLHFKF